MTALLPVATPAPPPTLAELEALIERSLTSFLDVGEALLAIRTRQLYREAGYSRFEDYVADRFELSRRRGYQLMDAREAMEAMCTIVHTPLPATEGQYRELVPLTRADPGAAAAVWDATYLAAGGHPTALALHAAVADFLQPAPPPPPWDDGTGGPAPAAYDPLAIGAAGWTDGTLEPPPPYLLALERQGRLQFAARFQAARATVDELLLDVDTVVPIQLVYVLQDDRDERTMLRRLIDRLRALARELEEALDATLANGPALDAAIDARIAEVTGVVD